MPGNILYQLSSVKQADGTAMTSGPGNTNFSAGGSTGSGNTAIHLDAAKMGQIVGLRLSQGGTNQCIFYRDLDSAVTQLNLRIPFSYSTTPKNNVAWLRTFSDLGRTADLFTVLFTTTNRLQFTEKATGGLNISSASGTPLVPGSAYVMFLDIDVTGANPTAATPVYGTLTITVYEAGATNPLFTLSSTTGLLMTAAMASIRWGIGTASSLDTLDTNNTWAAGTGGRLARADVANVAPTLSLTAAQGVTAGATVNVAATATDSDGSIASYAWSVVSASSTSSPALTGAATANVSFTAPAVGGLVTLQCVVTDNGGATTTATTEVRVPLIGTATIRPLALSASGSGSWSLVGGSANGGAALADDDDATYLESPAVTATEVTRRSRLQPAGGRSSLQLKLRLWTDAGTANVTVRLYGGTTLRQSWTQALTSTATEYTFTASATAIANTGDWGNLYAEVGATT